MAPVKVTFRPKGAFKFVKIFDETVKNIANP